MQKSATEFSHGLDLSFFSSKISATEHKVYTVTNESILMTNDHELWTFHARSMFNPETSLPFMEGNHAKENYNNHKLLRTKESGKRKPNIF